MNIISLSVHMWGPCIFYVENYWIELYIKRDVSPFFQLQAKSAKQIESLQGMD